MMPWIESHTELAQHPKLHRLGRTLRISVPTAIGHLHLLWWWALTYAQDGDLSGLDAVELAAAAWWEGEPEAWRGALHAAGFVDEDGRLHDWEDYAGRLLEKRRTDAERLRRWRSQRKMAPDAAPDEALYKGNAFRTRTKQALETRTSQVTVPIPDRTGKHYLPGIGEVEISHSKAADAVSASQSEAVDELFAYYRTRIQPRARDPSDRATRAMQARLRTWSLADLKIAIDHGAADGWYMANTAHRGAAWFFASDDRIETFVNLPPRHAEERNGTSRRPDHPRAPANPELAPLAKYR